MVSIYKINISPENKVGEIIIKIYRIIHNIKNKIGETDSEIEMWNIISANSHTSKYTISRDDNGMDISVDCPWIKYKVEWENHK